MNLSRGFVNYFPNKGGDNINLKPKYERYNIKSRAAVFGITMTELLTECNKRTGRAMRIQEFSAARTGKDRTACAEQTIEMADTILKELELQEKERTAK